MCSNVALESGTERAFSGETVNGYSHSHKAPGLWTGSVGGLPLFSSETKFDSGTGWPSFYAPLDPEHVIEVRPANMPQPCRPANSKHPANGKSGTRFHGLCQ